MCEHKRASVIDVLDWLGVFHLKLLNDGRITQEEYRRIREKVLEGEKCVNLHWRWSQG